MIDPWGQDSGIHHVETVKTDQREIIYYRPQDGLYLVLVLEGEKMFYSGDAMECGNGKHFRLWDGRTLLFESRGEITDQSFRRYDWESLVYSIKGYRVSIGLDEAEEE